MIFKEISISWDYPVKRGLLLNPELCHMTSKDDI